MVSHTFSLFADYYQFYLQDEPARGDLSDAWNDDEAVSRMLAVAPGVVGIGTARNTFVPVSINVLDEEPTAEFTSWEQVAECTLLVQSGRVVVAGCTEYFPDAPRINVAPGTYRVRACYAGLGTVSKDGLEGNDSYHVYLWRAPAILPRVLKPRAV